MLANAKLAKVSNWMMAYNLIINITKTVALFISPNLRKPVTELTLTFNDETVYPSNTAKYLGVLLDNELFLKSHIISLEKKNRSFHNPQVLLQKLVIIFQTIKSNKFISDTTTTATK